MKISNQGLHDLTGAATRLTAIVSLLRDPEIREELDPSALDRDVLAALELFREIWLRERAAGPAGSNHQ
jgi:hypothetical protein